MGLKCPKCKESEYVIMCLASNPPQFEYQCTQCGWSLRYFNRDNSYLQITQTELDFKFKHNK